MVLKDVKVRENLAMDGNHHPHLRPFTTSGGTSASSTQVEANMEANPIGANLSDTTFPLNRRRAYTLSLTALFLLSAFFICTLLAVSLLVYNFTACETEPSDIDPGEERLCAMVRRKYPSLLSIPELDSDNEVHKYEQDVRLPRSIRPLLYNISLIPFLQEDNFTFKGEVQIRVLVLEDCYNITLHATDLNIAKGDIEVLRADDNRSAGNVSSIDNRVGLRIRKQYPVVAKQFFVIELYDKLLKNIEYEVRIRFDGVINNYLQGFYRSSYIVGNQTKWMASTQFQATDARRAFPCFDEPALKARFTLTIARPSHLAIVSNMPLRQTRRHESIPNYVWDYFTESLPMSTYLVAYAISDFGHLNVGNFSVWVRSNALQSAQYALKWGPRILHFLEQFFEVPFPLPKMDMIALPDFQAGAMENWGLITYRETAMLFEEGISATVIKQRIATVVSHELAHQWFGNLVTPNWWSDLWLNEGFATYMEYLIVDALEPEWRVLEHFVLNELQVVFQLDALSTSHKISVEVNNPDEISDLFDRISYAKGATIIRMMSHFLTSNVFQRGVSNYLSEMSYSSATQDDLWHFLTKEATASGLLDKSTSVKEIMDTWTLQEGYPVLNVARNNDSHIVRLEQQRFVFVNVTSGDKEKSKVVEPLWWIPLTYTTAKELDFTNTRPTTWIPRTKVYEIENTNLSTATWYIFNIQQTGYYRVNYELSNWHAITAHLMQPEHHQDIAPTNRAQLIDDAMNLARGGFLPYSVALNLTRYLQHEHDHMAWKAAITAFNLIDGMFINQGDYDLLKNYLLRILEHVYKAVGFVDDVSQQEDMLTLFKRIEILNMACHLGHRHCIEESAREFQNWVQVPNPDLNNPISPNLRNIVYCSAIQYGTENEWNFAYERFVRSSVSTEKELLLSALGCTKEPWIMYRYLRRSIDGDEIRKQDLFRVFSSVANNGPIGQHVVFDFIRTNLQDIQSYLEPSMSTLYTLLQYSTKRMNTKYQLSELEAFVREDLKSNGRPVRQIIEQVQVNVDWMNRNYKSIVEWLKDEARNVAAAQSK